MRKIFYLFVTVFCLFLISCETTKPLSIEEKYPAEKLIHVGSNLYAAYPELEGYTFVYAYTEANIYYIQSGNFMKTGLCKVNIMVNPATGEIRKITLVGDVGMANNNADLIGSCVINSIDNKKSY